MPGSAALNASESSKQKFTTAEKTLVKNLWQKYRKVSRDKSVVVQKMASKWVKSLDAQNGIRKRTKGSLRGFVDRAIANQDMTILGDDVRL
jgi:hypothetical protein